MSLATQSLESNSFKRNKQNSQVKSGESCFILVVSLNIHACSVTNIENRECFESLPIIITTIIVAVVVGTTYLQHRPQLMFDLILVLFNQYFLNSCQIHKRVLHKTTPNF